MISKELLSIILDEYIETVLINKKDNTDNNIYYCDFETTDYIDCFAINIYELAHKCKEWADKQNFAIKSYIWFGKGKSIFTDLEDKVYSTMFDAETEPEAIIKACEWILQNKENK